MKRILFAAAVACGLLACSGDDGKDGAVVALPTVQNVTMMTCRDFCGHKRDEQVSLDRIARSNKYCLVGDECFFDCPPKDC